MKKSLEAQSGGWSRRVGRGGQGERVCAVVAAVVEESPAVQMNKASAVQAGEVLLWERLGGGLGLQPHKGVFSSWPGGQDGMGAGTRGRGAGQAPSPPTQLAPVEKQQCPPRQPEAAAAQPGKGTGVPPTPHKVSVPLPLRLGAPLAVYGWVCRRDSPRDQRSVLAQRAG